MKTKSLLILVFVIASAFGDDAPSVTVTTLDGKHYEHVAVTRRTALDVTFTHDDGTATVLYARLPEDARKQLGYNSAEAAAAQEAIDAARRTQAAQQQQQALETQKDTQRLAVRRAKLREQASKRLLMASREDQLRAASAMRMLEARKGKPLSLNDWQFLTEETRWSILSYVPDLAPDPLVR